MRIDSSELTNGVSVYAHIISLTVMFTVPERSRGCCLVSTVLHWTKRRNQGCEHLVRSTQACSYELLIIACANRLFAKQGMLLSWTEQTYHLISY